MKINDILDTSRGVITVAVNEKVSTALKTLIDNNISCLPVVDSEGGLLGIISERDILREVSANSGSLNSRLVADAMTKDILIGLVQDDLDYIMNIMSKNNIRHIPIMSGNTLTGIISIRDVVKGLMHKVEAENRYLKDYIEGKYEGYQ
ncbi:MAG: CBS domain-containing protein [Nitrospirota bacterium]